MKVIQMIRKLVGSTLLFLAWYCGAQVTEPDACGPTPSQNQLRWQEMEYYAFIHFSLNTYTDQPWGYGNEDIELFNPENVDCREWARICKESGMKGIILTAKHHSGFCLWPSEYTEYSVKNAPWKNGNGDLVRELSEACREFGLKFGVYLSPWDRNHADYGRPEYITYFRNQLTELLTQYGPIFEVWFDGAHGGDGYYGGANEVRNVDRSVYYDWEKTYALVRELQPEIVIWNDGGKRADLRWVGTEEGYVGETNWSLLNATGDVEWRMLHYGLEDGNAWVPAEVNTSIRPEWFYHPNEDDRVKTVPQLLDTYYHSVGRNATLLLNFPIMPDGRIHANDQSAALGLAKALKEIFDENLVFDAGIEACNVRGDAERFSAAMVADEDNTTYWATDDQVTEATLTMSFDEPKLFNRFQVQEYIPLGQRVRSFRLEARMDQAWQEIARGTTIGYKRILRFPSVEATAVRFVIEDAKCSPLISNIGIFNAPLFLNAPQIERNQEGKVRIHSVDVGPLFYYTVDGSDPTLESNLYQGPFQVDGKCEIRAIAYDPGAGKTGAIGSVTFDISKQRWKLVGVDDDGASSVLDGDPSTAWHQEVGEEGMPVDLVIDLGETHTLKGFRYLPDQEKWSRGILVNYRFHVSGNGRDWDLVSEGEFSNIRNNPVMQTKTFDPVVARYVKLQALSNTAGDAAAGYAELDVITE